MIECKTLAGSKILCPKSQLVVRPSAYAVIKNNEQVLLVTNTRSGRLYLPGGGIEKGERLTDGLRREILEETGVEVADPKLIHVAEDFFYQEPLDTAYHALLFYYVCTPKTLRLVDSARPGDDEGNPHWVDTASLTAENFHNHGEILLEVLKAAAAF